MRQTLIEQIILATGLNEEELAHPFFNSLKTKLNDQSSLEEIRNQISIQAMEALLEQKNKQDCGS